MSEVPPIATVPAVPRWERMAAGFLVFGYALLWASFPAAEVPWWMPFAMILDGAAQLVDFSPTGPAAETSYLGAALSTAVGALTVCTIYLGACGLARAGGRGGLLRDRSLWKWAAGHAAALDLIMLLPLIDEVVDEGGHGLTFSTLLVFLGCSIFTWCSFWGFHHTDRHE